MSTLIVVGNAEPLTDYSAFIDKCDLVFRFNFTPHFETGKTGQLTTVLCLFGVPYPRGDNVPGLNSHVIATCRSIWVEVGTFAGPLERGYGFARSKIRLMNLHAVRDRHQIGAQPITAPSSGFQVLRYLVNSPEYASRRRYICGFGWRGGAIHHWELEKEQVGHYLKLGLLESLDG